MSANRFAPRVLVSCVLAMGVAGGAAAQPTAVLPQTPGIPPAGGGDSSGDSSVAPVTVEVVPQPEPVQPVRDHHPDALAVLEAAEKAIAELQAFQTTLTRTASGLLKGTSLEGTANIMARRSPEDPSRWQVRITGPMTPERSSAPIDIDAALDGNRIKYIDRENRIVGARVIPVRINPPYYNVPAAIYEQDLWIRPDPFHEMRSAERMTLEARQTIDGVECDVVRGTLPGGQRTIMVAVGVEDRLPRRLAQNIEVRLTPEAAPMKGENATSFTDLTLDPELSDADFVLAVPDGFQDQQFPQQAPVGNPVSPNIVPKPPTESGADGADGGDSSAVAAGMEGGDEAMQALLNQVTSSVVTPPGSGARPAAVEMALDFELKDAAGQTVRLADLRGQPAVLLFWGSWSPWARDLAAALAPVAREATEARFLVMAVRERSAQTSAQRFEALDLRATLLPGADEVAARYEIGAVPTIVVIDAAGRITLRHAGYSAAASPIERIRQALGLSTAP